MSYITTNRIFKKCIQGWAFALFWFCFCFPPENRLHVLLQHFKSVLFSLVKQHWSHFPGCVWLWHSLPTHSCTSWGCLCHIRSSARPPPLPSPRQSQAGFSVPPSPLLTPRCPRGRGGAGLSRGSAGAALSPPHRGRGSSRLCPGHWAAVAFRGSVRAARGRGSSVWRGDLRFVPQFLMLTYIA